MSSHCQELNALHSQCVDGARIKIPDRLLKPDEEIAPPFITDLLAEEAKVFAQEFSETHARDLLSTSSADDARDLISRLLSTSSETPSFSEYELFEILLRYAQKHSIDITPLLTHISFSALTSANKHALTVALSKMNIEVPNALWNR